LYPPVSEKKQNVKSTIIITEGKLSGAVFMPIGALGRRRGRKVYSKLTQ